VEAATSSGSPSSSAQIRSPLVMTGDPTHPHDSRGTPTGASPPPPGPPSEGLRDTTVGGGLVTAAPSTESSGACGQSLRRLQVAWLTVLRSLPVARQAAMARKRRWSDLGVVLHELDFHEEGALRRPRNRDHSGLIKPCRSLMLGFPTVLIGLCRRALENLLGWLPRASRHRGEKP